MPPFVLHADDDDIRFEANRVAPQRVSLFGVRFDDFPVFDDSRQLAFLQSRHKADAKSLSDDGEHAIQMEPLRRQRHEVYPITFRFQISLQLSYAGWAGS